MNKETIQKILYETANLCLEIPVEHQKYTPEDLFNASLIFLHFYNDLAFTYLENKPITNEGKLELIEELGKNLRQTILLGTGIDMHEQAKK